MARVNPLQDLNRKIYFNDPIQNQRYHYPTNYIKTCKYTLLTFLPKSLYLQFLRLANIYFLFITILTSFDEISPYSPVTSIIPLTFVLVTSMIREALEDWVRYKNDKITNAELANVYRKPPVNPGENEQRPILTQVIWKDLVVGDIVRINNDQQIPADILLLATSDENGVAYVETANLDGEKNLKPKQVKPEIKTLVKQVGIEELKGAMLIDSPNARIHHFKGVMELEGADTIYLNYSNLLLRGTFLKNTEYVIGIIVYSGHDTKLMKSQGKPKNKKSHIEINLNKYIIGIFVIQCLLCVVLTVLSFLFTDKYEEYYETGQGLWLSYLFSATESPTLHQAQHDSFTQFVIDFAIFILLLNTLIPLSLMVSLELTKFYQAKWIEYDDLIKDGNQRCKSLNMQIHEDLAKIEYIFADKTGTLTTNEMKFMECSIQGKPYSKDELINGAMLTPSNETERAGASEYFRLFWLSLSLCHEVVIDKKHLDNHDIRTRYQGSSPDEVELVSAAAEIGFIFKEKKGEVYSTVIQGKTKDFELLARVDFSSDRKRMSVVMKDLETNKLFLFCKGADSMILKRLKKDTSHHVLEKTKEDLKHFSIKGLRTLVVSYKELEAEEFAMWQRKYTQAQQEEFNVEAEVDHQVKLRELEEELEKGMELLGATALEDRLQDGVADTIRDLHKAQIKIWMLTGDKLETAENIGYATSLIASDTKVFKVHTSNVDETLEKYTNIQKKIASIKEGNYEPLSSREDIEETDRDAKILSFALIIDGEAISYTFGNDKLKSIFLELIPEFRTVICCRSTPSQKANVVTFVKHNLKKMTLAIGDGGNDVNMIQQAHVGVGIFGKEGNQAAFSSDYAISQFYFLWRLLLVHGRWSYLRTANFITFFIYKNIIFTLPQFWFALSSGFSGQTFYSDLYLSNYNTIFTSVAPVCYALQEQDINPKESETIRKAMPRVYAEFRKTNLFSFSKFMFWWIVGIQHSVMIFYMIQAGTDGTVDGSGRVFEFWRESMTALSSTICLVFIVIIMGANHYQIVTLVCYVLLTLLVYFPVGSLTMDQFNSTIYHVVLDMLEIPNAWLTIILVLAACSLILYIPKVYACLFRPSLVDLLQRDRNKNGVYKEITSPTNTSTQNLKGTESKYFEFNAAIMMDGWYVPGAGKGRFSYINEKESPE